MKYTIIITIYNKEKFLEKAITSACTQTYKDYTVMVVNDGSTDNSEKIILNLQKKYKFKYYKKENTGVADTRNYAIKKVVTPYFLFLDADDYLENNLLETIDKYNDYDILSFNSINKDEKDNIIEYINKPKYQGYGEKFIQLLIKDKITFTVPWGYIYNTKYFKNNKYEYLKGEILEDFELTPFILADARKIISIDYCGYNYITNSKSIVNNKDNLNKIADTYLRHYQRMLKKTNESNYSEETKKYIKDLLSGTIIWYVNNLDKNKQKECIKKIKDLKAVNNLNKNIILKTIIKISYMLNIYYSIRNIYISILKKETSKNIQKILYGDKYICNQIAFVMGYKDYKVITKDEINKYSNEKIIFCKNDIKKKRKDISINELYNEIDSYYKHNTLVKKDIKSILKHILIVYRPRLKNINIIRKLSIKIIKPSEMLIKELNASPINIKCKRMEETCYIDMHGDIYACCPGWTVRPLGNILKDNYYDNYFSRIMKLSSINKSFCFCQLDKCKHIYNDKKQPVITNLEVPETPKELTIAFDQSCNLKCSSCRKKHYNAKGKQLELAERIKDRVIESSWLDKSNIIVAGQGEVFFSKIYKELISTNIKRNDIEILSNGTLFNKKRFEEIKNNYKKIKVSISVDAVCEETYKHLRCGNFKILLNNLKMLSEERKKGNIEYLQFNYVVQRDNYKEMREFVKLAKSLNIDCVQFTKLGNWGTFKKKEYIKKSMIKNNILDYELYKELNNDIYKDKLIDIDSFKDNLIKSREYYGDKYE